MFNKILVPLDGSELAEAVLPYVQEVAHKFGSAITLFRVCDPMPAMMPAEPGILTPIQPEIVVDAIQAELAYAEEYLSTLRDRLNADGLKTTYQVERGNPAEEIMRYAKEQAVDLIAMSTHGRSGLLALVFGSVASEVLGQAGTPILLIRSQGR